MSYAESDKANVVEVMKHEAIHKEIDEAAVVQESTDGTDGKVYKSDDSDGKVDWNFRKVLAAVSLCGLYTSSQLLLYFVGGVLDLIVADIGGASTLGWIPTAYLIALSAVSPFVGYLQDLFGRRFIGITGQGLLCLGCILLASAHSFGQAVAGMAISGAGAAIGELTALAGISEIVPVKRRAVAVAAITLGMIPWQPFVLYGQLLAKHSGGWRNSAWLCFAYGSVVFIGLVCAYSPKAHHRAEGLTKNSIVAQLDYVGGILSIAGITLVLIALQAGGYTKPWRSAYVLVQLVIGFVLLAAFVIWEWKNQKNAIIPADLFQGQRVVILVYAVAFVAGMNFFSFINLFPFVLSSVYQPDSIQLGVWSFGFSMGVGVGVPLGDAMLAIVKGQVRIVLCGSAVIMTAFLGALAASNPTNPITTTVLGTFTGLGCGGILTPAATVALIVVPDVYLATAAALSLSIRGVGGAIGYAIYSSIMNNKLKTKLPAYVATYAIQAGLPVSLTSHFVETFLGVPAKASSLPGVTLEIMEAARLGSRWAFADSLKYVWYSTIPFGILAIVCSAFVPSVAKWQTNRIRAQI